jgi:hypothetical protein
MAPILKGTIAVRDEDVSLEEESNRYVHDNQGGSEVCFVAVIKIDGMEVPATSFEHEIIGKIIPNNMPVKLFFGKKDGDTFDLFVNGVKITVTCRQSNREKKFEDMLFCRSHSFGGINQCSPTPEIVQYSALIKSHYDYAKSIGVKPFDPSQFQFFSSSYQKCLLPGMKSNKLNDE